jgi:hypothetical protein
MFQLLFFVFAEISEAGKLAEVDVLLGGFQTAKFRFN